MAKKDKKGIWILGNLATTLQGEALNPTLAGVTKSWVGHAVVGYPTLERHTRLNYTGPLGSIMGIYYSLVFQLGKWEHNVKKADEWIEVSPVHAQYYQLTVKQKEDLENKIKQGLGQVSQAVADSELLGHDKRRYEEFLHYLGYRSYKELGKQKDLQQEEDPTDIDFEEDEKKIKSRQDNHSLKAVFIDQVDVHTGEGISMRSIVSRWPTLISDFMHLDDTDLNPEKVMAKLEISKAESVILVTKNKLYQEWKELFGPEIKNRYVRINQLLQARRTSVHQYREWLKPFIARHKLINEGLSAPGSRAFNRTSQYVHAGQATSGAEIVLYVWKDFSPPEIFKGGTEETGKMIIDRKTWENKEYSVDDPWTMRNLIFNKEWGLKNEFPWITKGWVKEKKIEMFRDGWLTPHKPYYTFFVIKLERNTIRQPDGNEMDDGTFDISYMIFSQNAMFAKLLELKAKEKEFEDHVNRLLGLHNPAKDRGEVQSYAEEKENPVTAFLGKYNIDFRTAWNKGPYERNFNDRITKGYLMRAGADRYGPIVGFLKKRMGIGGG